MQVRKLSMIYLRILQDMEEGSGHRAKGNHYTEMPTLKSSEENHTPEETALAMTESRGPGETNEPQPESQTPPVFPPTYSPPVTPQAAAIESSEEIVASLEAKKIVNKEVDHYHNPSIPAPSLDNESQCATMNRFNTPQVHVYIWVYYMCIIIIICTSTPTNTFSVTISPNVHIKA